LRQEHPELFQEGEYLPLAVEGAKANHIVAFARKSETSSVLVVVPRLVTALLNDVDAPPIGSRIWEDTQLLIPFCSCSKKYRNVFTGKILDPERGDGYEKIAVADVLSEFPLGLFVLE
jgi:(1->4)-alpha-D-glucan 1-alpha-D-glucosylmutase